MSSAYAKYPARYLFVPRSSARINTGRGCPLLPVIFVSPRYAAVRCIAAGCAVYVLSAVLDIGGDNAIYRRRRGYVRMQNVQHIAAGVQYMYCQPCWILAVTIQYIAVGEVYVLLPAVQHIAAGVQYICRQPYLILPVTKQYIAVGVAVFFFQLCSLSAAGVQYICRQPCLILPMTMQYIAVSIAIDFCQLCGCCR